MAELTLKQRKRNLAQKWEQCFEQAIEGALTEKGLEVFWSDDTSFEDAEKMLDKAAILEALEALEGLLPQVIVAEVLMGGKTDEPCNVKNGTPYRVVGVPDSYIYKHEFETVEAAKEFIKNEAMHSILSVNDFLVVQVVNNV